MIKKLAQWILSIFEEDNGKASMKRILCVPAFAIVAYIVIHCLRNGISIKEYTYPISLLLGFIATLLGMTYIPSRNTDDK
jgi:hypothetical protein